MTPQPLASRVESLEKHVTQLEQLPARIDGLESQIEQLRTEMHDEFSAMRGETNELGTSLRAEISEQGKSLRGEIGKLGAKVEQQGMEMRVLHEEVISRIALIQEGLPARRQRRT